jgi:hypothetical protein
MTSAPTRGRYERLAALLAAAGADVRVVGSVAAGAPRPHDLDVVVIDDAEAIDRLLDALDVIGTHHPPVGARPTSGQVRAAGMLSCWTSYGRVDAFVGGLPPGQT